MEGGRNSGQQVITYIWNSYDNNKPLEFRFDDPGNQMSKTSRKIEAYAGLFVPGTPDPERFQLPKYCERESNMEHDAIFENLKLHFEM